MELNAFCTADSLYSQRSIDGSADTLHQHALAGSSASQSLQQAPLHCRGNPEEDPEATEQ